MNVSEELLNAVFAFAVMQKEEPYLRCRGERRHLVKAESKSGASTGVHGPPTPEGQALRRPTWRLLNLSTTPRNIAWLCHCCSSTASRAAWRMNWCRYCARSSLEPTSPPRAARSAPKMGWSSWPTMTKVRTVLDILGPARSEPCLVPRRGGPGAALCPPAVRARGGEGRRRRRKITHSVSWERERERERERVHGCDGPEACLV